MNNTNNPRHENVLRTLRDLTPHRPLTPNESLRVAELQANRLLALTGVTGPRVPSTSVTDLPRLRVVDAHDIPASGSTHWQDGQWVVTLNAREPATRRRFSLFHELKHIIDHPARRLLYQDPSATRAYVRTEYVADYFAGCVLMPKRWLKRCWGEGTQSIYALASIFDVSPRAVEVRLHQVGLIDTLPRGRVICTRPARRRMTSAAPGSKFVLSAEQLNKLLRSGIRMEVDTAPEESVA